MATPEQRRKSAQTALRHALEQSFDEAAMNEAWALLTTMANHGQLDVAVAVVRRALLDRANDLRDMREAGR